MEENKKRIDDFSEIPCEEIYSVPLQKGKAYSLCACGRSRKKPFCDGSHIGTKIKPVLFLPEHTTEYTFCICKGSCQQPKNSDYTHLDW
ncbi:unnamed protein product [Blepharisma stoltei]|uniref:Iron-binding zinc finger CDGSH type domain-containing protein n=1 Tax=Blepharisma stoltei TaxID=1481888 RepID=A0AAU9JKD5_9CILI|nr:unnamed protein product [Blepharisma stoltei]